MFDMRRRDEISATACGNPGTTATMLYASARARRMCGNVSNFTPDQTRIGTTATTSVWSSTFGYVVDVNYS